ncbi:glycosyltransferase family 2 protein [Chryseobacterium sp. Hurlbut01]|uniref:glycosyltransferase family 2 protein n=1 Tax=Chryseobacterium sp. Hurlbut01 TaxID=1681828 RepID=UPI00067C2069|nr:glycosyltransferase [Chryseobacterium sp. Hurlbut01]KNB61248.1 hypothetical protein AC804_11825 [Chryseobacterium sp. Hurlbut01]
MESISKNLENNFPLVSVIVITYNSAEFVIETLESIKEQSYRNIELIVSDDCSRDNTVQICKEWMEYYGSHFSRTQIVSVTENSGIPANCNRGVNAAKGEWIKVIAGDDLLMKDCIKDFVEFSTKKKLEACVSELYEFIDGEPTNLKLIRPSIYSASTDVNKQFRELLKSFFGNAPTFFIKKSVFDNLSFDENIKFMEDYPLAINLNRRGIFIYYLPKPTVLYRIRNNSASNEDNIKIFSNFYKKLEDFNRIYRYPYMSKTEYFTEHFEIFKKDFFNRFGLNKNKNFNRVLFKYFSYINPFFVLNKIIK